MKVLEQEKPWWVLPSARVPPWVWLVLAVPLVLVEYTTGIYSQFPVVYVIPVSLAAWYSGRFPAVTLAVAIPLAHFIFRLLAGQAPDVALVATSVLRGSVIIFMALWFARLSEHERALQHEVQTLKGLLPICLFCKSIRNDSGEWERLEPYISRRSETQFSHCICPPCQQIHYGAFAGSGRA
jgi:two-component system sensor histidine kinase TtrS